MNEDIQIPQEMMSEIRKILKDKALCFSSEGEFIREALRGSIVRYR